MTRVIKAATACLLLLCVQMTYSQELYPTAAKWELRDNNNDPTIATSGYKKIRIKFSTTLSLSFTGTKGDPYPTTLQLERSYNFSGFYFLPLHLQVYQNGEWERNTLDLQLTSWGEVLTRDEETLHKVYNDFLSGSKVRIRVGMSGEHWYEVSLSSFKTIAQGVFTAGQSTAYANQTVPKPEEIKSPNKTSGAKLPTTDKGGGITPPTNKVQASSGHTQQERDQYGFPLVLGDKNNKWVRILQRALLPESQWNGNYDEVTQKAIAKYLVDENIAYDWGDGNVITIPLYNHIVRKHYNLGDTQNTKSGSAGITTTTDSTATNIPQERDQYGFPLILGDKNNDWVQMVQRALLPENQWTGNYDQGTEKAVAKYLVDYNLAYDWSDGNVITVELYNNIVRRLHKKNSDSQNTSTSETANAATTDTTTTISSATIKKDKYGFPLVFGDKETDYLKHIQIALLQESQRTGVYDQNTMTAVAKFISDHNIKYDYNDGQVITLDLYNYMIERLYKHNNNENKVTIEYDIQRKINVYKDKDGKEVGYSEVNKNGQLIYFKPLNHKGALLWGLWDKATVLCEVHVTFKFFIDDENHKMTEKYFLHKSILDSFMLGQLDKLEVGGLFRVTKISDDINFLIYGLVNRDLCKEYKSINDVQYDIIENRFKKSPTIKNQPNKSIQPDYIKKIANVMCVHCSKIVTNATQMIDRNFQKRQQQNNTLLGMLFNLDKGYYFIIPLAQHSFCKANPNGEDHEWIVIK